MVIRSENTPHSLTGALVTGHFKQKRGYWAWRERGTQDWLLIYTAGGSGRFGFKAGEVVTRVGEVVLLKPGTPHDYGVEPELESWELLWVHFRPRAQWLEWMGWPLVHEEAPGLMRLSLGEEMRLRVHKRLLAMHALATGSHLRREALAMNALEEVLLLCDEVNPLQAQGRLDARVRSVMDFMCRRLGEPMRLDRLAGGVNLSVSRLGHLFREELGVSPQRFLEVQRLERAKQLLALTAESVKEISYKVGFSSPFYFSMRFKRYTGKSPKMWRAEERKDGP